MTHLFSFKTWHVLVHGAMYVVEDVKMQFDEKNRPDYKNGVRADRG